VAWLDSYRRDGSRSGHIVNFVNFNSVLLRMPVSESELRAEALGEGTVGPYR